MRDELQFIINEEKKTVVCIAHDCALDLIRDIQKNFSSKPSRLMDFLMDRTHVVDDFMLEDTYKGIAKCQDEDVFDVEIGKAIAIKKMRVNYNIAKAKKLSKFVNLYDEVLTVFDAELKDYYINNACRAEEKILQYTEN